MPNYRRYYLKGYQYIFITVVTFNRNKILLDNIELLRNSFKYALNKFDFEIFAIAVLDDHFHIILKVKNTEDYPKIIYSVKNYFSRRIDKSFLNQENLSKSKQKRREKGVWQRRYWDHIIRNEQDLNVHLDYIHYNPVKHGFVTAPKDYKYSSFEKFVKLGFYDENWYNCGDINKISELDFE